MAVTRVILLLLITVFEKCRSESINGYNNYNNNDASHLGQILKPPPPPPLPNIPVPFALEPGRLQHQNNFEHQYQTPPPSPPTKSSIVPYKDFQLPAPFYKQYNFNFVPPPQPFSSTPSPTIFQKISGWLFPSQQTSSDKESQVNQNQLITHLQKDCNPCNLIPWIPVIRYDLTSSKGRQNLHSTYSPPSPTTTTNLNSAHNFPQAFSQQNNYNLAKYSTGIPHATYGPPTTSHLSNIFFNFPSSTYGPPSPTHIINTSKQASQNYPHSASTSIELPKTSKDPSLPYNLKSLSYGVPSSTYKVPTSTSKSPYVSPSLAYQNFLSTSTRSPVPLVYKPELLNQYLPTQNDVEILSEIQPSSELQLPKVTHPTGFRNSYGEPIINKYSIDIPYSATLAGAASSKINTEILPNDTAKIHNSNMTMALSNPAPFSLNRARNIHTLQPVALPNLSISPLPPIFNARPFRLMTTKQPFNAEREIKNLQHVTSNSINIAKSVPIAEYTHSVEYPTTIIQSPVIDIDISKNFNYTKGYRNIQNSYVIDEIRDISSQASEDHISETKSKQDSSFESIDNNLYNSNIPLDFKQYSKAPIHNKVNFADLRGLKDEDVDKYRTESNLQYIDSPLLYLKPSAPHKNYNNFFFTVTTPGREKEYEIYDDITTTTESTQVPLTSGWEESRSDRPKIVQIIIPYTNPQRSSQDKEAVNFSFEQQDSTSLEKRYQGRKIQLNTVDDFSSITTEAYKTLSTTTEEPMSTTTDSYEFDHTNTPSSLNDDYTVEEPPFDIVKLQHTIDDWTEQEYSKSYSTPQRTRSNENYAKQIPDDFFTTNNPLLIYSSEPNNYNFDFIDHEGSSSMHHIVTENQTTFNSIKRKEYNTIERYKNKYNNGKNEEAVDTKKLHIYTAASTFRRTTTTTPAPWGEIQTSISPLTNEKIYVVTSKPWRESITGQNYNNEFNILEHNRTDTEIEMSTLDELPFKSPRFTNRPLYGFMVDGLESIKLDSPYGFSKGWYRRINNLEYPTSIDSTSFEEFEKDPKTTNPADENK